MNKLLIIHDISARIVSRAHYFGSRAFKLAREIHWSLSPERTPLRGAKTQLWLGGPWLGPKEGRPSLKEVHEI